MAQDAHAARTMALRAVDHLSHRQIDQLASLFAEDALMTFPFAPEGFSQRIEGREAIAKALRILSDLFASFEITATRAVADQHGDVVIEAESVATLKDGKPYRNGYVFVVEVRDGAIRLWKEYNNPMRLPRPAA